ncbi:DNA-directed RNA polymerase IV subunit 1 isoform X2 [Nymphaea colorata]|uniref:DNA-directed RNA polymerase IV subunit 1 isoform X2 n=1 Tax=Nymphaea colorata TaxID=210225 RepID=UPI00214EF34A|nr:DNA-directed RNA polymerase IV subunit 1 isoform X2 [Nymphaea colorata]
MDDEKVVELSAPLGHLAAIEFQILTDDDMRKFAVMEVKDANDVCDPKLGIPNPSSSPCTTCGSANIKFCDGHYGFIGLPIPIYHPALLHEIVQILNKICPGCKSLRRRKVNSRGILGFQEDSAEREVEKSSGQDCKYCDRRGYLKQLYPLPKFKFTAKDINGRKCMGIMMEAKGGMLADDYWDFVKADSTLEVHNKNIVGRFLSPYQAFCLLRVLDPAFVHKYVQRRESLLISSIPITPNRHRVVEVNSYLAGSALMTDEHSKIYRRLVSGFSSAHSKEDVACTVGNLALDCFNACKLRTRTSQISESGGCNTGLRWMKDVILGKRSDFAFRMTVVGDPNLCLGEIGVPIEIAQKLVIPLHLNLINWKLVKACVESCIHQKAIYIRREGSLVSVNSMSQLEIGDVVYRSIKDGDMVLVNRPPSVHQHSLIAFVVRVLPLKSVVSINPLCCRPFFGDFDGDCFHGFVPQSVNARVELQELMALDRQLLNGQNGQTIVSLSHDSLTAAHIVTKGQTLFNKVQIQQLSMFCHGPLQEPAIVKAPLLNGSCWTGEQFFSMLLPQHFDYCNDRNGVLISSGELLVCSQDSGWLHNSSSSIISFLSKHGPSVVLDYLFHAQRALSEWISDDGLSVSLLDMYLSRTAASRIKMMEEVSCGLDDAECLSSTTHLMMKAEREFHTSNADIKHKPFAKAANHERNLPRLGCDLGDAFKRMYPDIINVILEHIDKDNSMLTMIGAGSTGNIQKLVQQGACLGLQSLRDASSFKIRSGLPDSQLSQSKASQMHPCVETNIECSQERSSFAVVRSSFLTGLSPLDCLVHSSSIRGASFSDNADVPGTLVRKLMFYMRDLLVCYDGTVRSVYGNQIIQFSYKNCERIQYENDRACYMAKYSNSSIVSPTNEISRCANNGIGGHPVGVLATCSISEALYGALDHPTCSSSSPLLMFKEALECGSKSTGTSSTASLYLSEELGQWKYGYEYGAMEIKRHLERVILSDVVDNILVLYCKDVDTIFAKEKHSPWIIHLHLNEEGLRRRALTVGFIVKALCTGYDTSRRRAKTVLPDLHMSASNASLCDSSDNYGHMCCIMVAEVCSQNDIAAVHDSSHHLNVVKASVIPVLLQTTIRGSSQFKNVDILWKDGSKKPGFRKSGKLYLRVVSDNCRPKKLWSSLQEACSAFTDLIDWGRSQPDSVADVFHGFGVDAAWNCFVNNMKSVFCDLGKTIHEEHLVVTADCLSVTGEFHGLNVQGIKQQRNQMSISSPFSQACFSKPLQWFTKAAKKGMVDDLSGALDAVSWGKDPASGTRGSFEILHSDKVDVSAGSGNIYAILCNSLPNSYTKKWKAYLTRTRPLCWKPCRITLEKEKKWDVEFKISRSGPVWNFRSLAVLCW